jgi:GT2 family glycosyltransferase
MSVDGPPVQEHRLSLCICTLDRPVELARCLSTLHAGSRLPDEILVADDSPDPEKTQSLCAQYSRVRYLRGPGAGLAAKRNQLLGEVSGTHILFPDDDVTFPPDFIARVYTIIDGMNPRSLVSGFNINHYPDGRSEKVLPHNPDFWGHQKLSLGDEPRAITMNATVLPASLFRHARFDERLIYGSEEIDLARQALALGYSIEYSEELYIDHHPPEVRRDYQSTRIVEGLRLFATTKAYWRYERAPVKAFIYAVLAPFQMIASAMRRRDTPARDVVGAVALAAKLGMSSVAGRLRGRRQPTWSTRG